MKSGTYRLLRWIAIVALTALIAAAALSGYFSPEAAIMFGNLRLC